MKQFRKFFALLMLLPLTSCGGTPYYKAAPIDAVVVDAETNLPIEGALVVANWQLMVSVLDGQRTKGQLEVKETSTDKSGRFHFDGFTKLNPMLYKLGALDPQIVIFKGGYRYERITNTYGRSTPGAYREAAVNGTVVKLRKLTPVVIGQTEVYYMGLSTALEPIAEDCEWKKIPRIIRAMDAEKQRIRALSPKATAWVISIEDLEGYSRECGSAVDYFRSHQK